MGTNRALIRQAQAQAAAAMKQGSAASQKQVYFDLQTFNTQVFALNSTQTLTITWAAAFPNATYTIRVAPSQPLLGQVTATVSSQTTTGCVVSLKATSAVSLTGFVAVAAFTTA